MTTRSYSREGAEITETVYVHVDPTGYVRMTANNLHAILERLGFTETTVKEPTR